MPTLNMTTDTLPTSHGHGHARDDETRRHGSPVGLGYWRHCSPLSLSAYVVRGEGEGGGIKVMDKLWRKRKRGRRTRAHVLAYSNQRRRSQRQLTPLPPSTHPTGTELPSIYNTLAWIIIIMCRTAHKHVKAQEIRVYNSLGGSWTYPPSSSETYWDHRFFHLLFIQPKLYLFVSNRSLLFIIYLPA